MRDDQAQKQWHGLKCKINALEKFKLSPINSFPNDHQWLIQKTFCWEGEILPYIYEYITARLLVFYVDISIFVSLQNKNGTLLVLMQCVSKFRKILPNISLLMANKNKFNIWIILEDSRYRTNPWYASLTRSCLVYFIIHITRKSEIFWVD